MRRTAPPTLMFGVGAPKCGTTWMHDYLATHPECHFRTFKEMHYFSSLHNFQLNWLLGYLESRVERLERNAMANQGAKRERLLQEIVDARDYYDLMKKRVDDRVGYSRYLLEGIGPKKLVGDITPAYGLLPVKVLKEMAATSVTSRFVYLIRDPVARLWSHVRMAVEQENVPSEQYEERSQELLRELLAGDKVRQRDLLEYSDYAGAIGRLREALPEEKVLIMFYEDLMTPAGVRRLCKFLGIRPHPGNVKKGVNTGRRAKLPEDLRAEMRRYLKPQYDFAAQYFPSLPAAWKKTMAEGFA